jgi:hypothetical protein
MAKSEKNLIKINKSGPGGGVFLVTYSSTFKRFSLAGFLNPQSLRPPKNLTKLQANTTFTIRCIKN